MSNYTLKFLYYYIMSVAVLMTAALVCAGSADIDMDENFSGAGAIELHQADTMPDRVPEMPHPPALTVPTAIDSEHMMSVEPIVTTTPAITSETIAVSPELITTYSTSEQQMEHENIMQELQSIKRKIKSLKRLISYEFKRLGRKVESSACHCTSTTHKQ
jgi:hypothetical protein